ncbi:MAG: hypothetical protein NZ516_12050 [Raineya sp.]|nr:hypothetical protein [Raineya sp.]
MKTLRDPQRYHPNAFKCSRFFQVTTGNCLVNYPFALENERWFDANYIPTGFFHDLRDFVNTNPDENTWDFVGGVTIRQMYLAFTPETTNFCNYINSLINQNSGLNFGWLNLIFERNTDNAQSCNS